MTTGPSAGPASAYPILRTPASICLSVPNDVLAPGLILGRSADLALLGWASAAPLSTSWAPTRVVAAAPKKRRRAQLISGEVLFVSMNRSPFLMARQARLMRIGCEQRLSVVAFRGVGFGHHELDSGAIQRVMIGVGEDDLDLVRSGGETNEDQRLAAGVSPMPRRIIDDDMDVPDAR